MGKGDKKTKRGKIVNKSYGVRRPRKKLSVAASPAEAEAIVSKVEKTTAADTKKAKVPTKAKADAKPKAAAKKPAKTTKPAVKPKTEVVQPEAPEVEIVKEKIETGKNDTPSADGSES